MPTQKTYAERLEPTKGTQYCVLLGRWKGVIQFSVAFARKCLGVAMKNDMAQVVGWSRQPQGSQKATLWTVDMGRIVTAQDLGTLPGGPFSVAWGINNLGQVVGFADGATGTVRPFIWMADTGMRDLRVPAGLVGGEAHRINDQGQVVGAFVTTGDNTGLSEQGTFAIWNVDSAGNVLGERNLGDLGGRGATAWDNNAEGNVVGDIWFQVEQTGLFWSEQDGVVEIDDTTESLGINDHGSVVGLGPGGGFVWTQADGRTVLGGANAMGINNAHQAIGRWGDQVLIWEDGDPQLLPMPQDRDWSWARSINEAGWAVGWSTDAPGNGYANLWMPN